MAGLVKLTPCQQRAKAGEGGTPGLREKGRGAPGQREKGRGASELRKGGRGESASS